MTIVNVRRGDWSVNEPADETRFEPAEAIRQAVAKIVCQHRGLKTPEAVVTAEGPRGERTVNPLGHYLPELIVADSPPAPTTP